MAKYSEVFLLRESAIEAEYVSEKKEAKEETQRALALERETAEELMLYNEHGFFSTRWIAATRWVAAKCRNHRSHKSRKWDNKGYKELGTTQFSDGSRNRQHTCHSIPRRAEKRNRIAVEDAILDIAEDCLIDHPRWNGEFINNKMEGDKVNTFSTIKMKEVDFDI